MKKRNYSDSMTLNMTCNSFQRTPKILYQASFYRAVSRNDSEAVHKFLKNCRDYIDIDKLGKEGISVLHKCCIEGYRTIIEILLNFGANIEVKDPEGWTPLHACAAAGKVNILYYLLSKGAYVMTYNKHGQLPIDVANDIETLVPLAKSMAQIGQDILAQKYLRSYKSKTIMDMSVIKTTIDSMNAEKEGNKLRKQWITDTKKHLRPILKRSQSLTVCQSSIGDSVLRHRLLDSDMKDRRRKVVSFPPNVLCQAYIADNDHEDLERLVSSGRIDDINKLDENGISAIHLASLEGSVECLTVLIESGARIDNRDPIGWTPLHAAAAMGNIACVKILLDAGAEISSCTDDGENVFELAQDDLVLEYLRMIASGSNLKRIHRQRSRRQSETKTFSICSTSSSGSSSGSE